jgi:hypothetical protein
MPISVSASGVQPASPRIGADDGIPAVTQLYVETDPTGSEMPISVALQGSVGIETSVAVTIWGLIGVLGLVTGYLLGLTVGG